MILRGDQRKGALRKEVSLWPTCRVYRYSNSFGVSPPPPCYQVSALVLWTQPTVGLAILDWAPGPSGLFPLLPARVWTNHLCCSLLAFKSLWWTSQSLVLWPQWSNTSALRIPKRKVWAFGGAKFGQQACLHDGLGPLTEIAILVKEQVSSFILWCLLICFSSLVFRAMPYHL